MNDIVSVNFRGDTLYAFRQDDGIFVAVKPMCDGIGLSYESQRQRIARDPVLSKATSIMLVPFGSARGQETTCLKLNRIGFFLATIDSGRIKDEDVRQKVILYQEECADVLHDHFSGKKRTDPDGDPSDDMSLTEKMRLADMVHRGFGVMAFRQLYFKVELPRVPAMYAPEQNDLFHYGMIAQAAE